eukprot:scaffold835_cov71-Cyclotella_meneghiniana.AAC.3
MKVWVHLNLQEEIDQRTTGDSSCCFEYPCSIGNWQPHMKKGESVGPPFESAQRRLIRGQQVIALVVGWAIW